MIRFLLLWAVCGTALTAAAQPVSPAALDATPREWTDASGTRRARATLLRIDGETVWLRRPNGHLTKTNLSNLSERDRQYVATRRPPSATKSTTKTTSAETTDPVTSVVEGVTETVETATETVTETVETIQQLPRWLGQGQPGETALVPAALVYVRVSRDFLEDYVERTVHRRKQVRDRILGARIVGHSHTNGRTHLTLIPSNRELRANIAFTGTVRAHTRGYKGPVVLHNISNSTFHAHKFVVMDDDFGVRVAPATADADTDLRITCISTSLPRLRGRIARRIASRRASQSRGRAEAITADHTADDIRDDFNTRVNRTMTTVQQVFGSKIPELETGRTPEPTDVRFRSRADAFEMAILRERATAEERKLRPPPADPHADVSVRIHRTLLTSAIADPELMQNLSPLFTKLLEARPKQDSERTRPATATTAAAATPKWSIAGGWILLDFKDTSR
jgi:hypothetical protein